jgi:thiol-disulfide isomerase/thioredoxin
MRNSLIFIAIILTFTSLFGQDTSKVVIDTVSGKPMFIGSCNRATFSDTSYSWWFNPGYQEYKPDSTIINEFKQNLNDIDITIVLGTWCSDSQEQVPYFFKIIDEADFPENRITMICVDRNRKSISGEVDSLNIKLVPTFIFYKDGKELGRIEETPNDTIEKDMYAIITKIK